jgi:integrin-linked kinase-associated serine/threonine phosphatase 2C
VSGYNQDGACAVLALIVERVVWVAFAGDCRAVLARTKLDKKSQKCEVKGIQLTKDHTPIMLAERQRIESKGGRVVDGRVNGILGVSRSFGDAKVKKAGVISQPDLMKFTISAEDRLLILACDGLWGVFSPQDAVDFVVREIKQAWQHELNNPVEENPTKLLEPKESMEQIVCRKATTRLIREAVMTRGSKDNTTAVVVLLDQAENIFKLDLAS